MLSVRRSTKGPAQCSFYRVLWNSFFGKVLLINVASTWNSSLIHCISEGIFADRRLCTGCSTKGGAHPSFRRTLWNNIFGKVLLINFVNAWKNLLEYCISAESLLTVGYVQGSLQKELRLAPFVECFRTFTLRSFTDSFYRYLAGFLLVKG